MNTVEALSVIVISVVGVLGAFGKFVGSIIKYIKALIDETKTNTSAVKSVGQKLDESVGSILGTLTDHENRITKLEKPGA